MSRWRQRCQGSLIDSCYNIGCLAKMVFLQSIRPEKDMTFEILQNASFSESTGVFAASTITSQNFCVIGFSFSGYFTSRGSHDSSESRFYRRKCQSIFWVFSFYFSFYQESVRFTIFTDSQLFSSNLDKEFIIVILPNSK